MKKNFKGLDTVRTALALAVAAGHYFYWNGTSTAFPRAFFLAVDFFFVLSGFVLFQSILFDPRPKFDQFFRAFVARRFFRLFPLYAVLFVASAATVLWLHGLADPVYYYAISAALLQAMGLDNGATVIFADTTIGIAWSISVEFWLSLAFFAAVFPLTKHPALLCSLCVAGAVLCLALIANYSPNVMDVNLQRVSSSLLGFGGLRCILGFCCGVVAFYGYRRIAGIQGRRLLSTIEIALVAVAAILFLPDGHDPRNDLLAPCLFAVIIVVLASEKGYLGKALTWRMWSPIRDISYSIYLVHPLFVFAWRQLGIPFSHPLVPIYLALVITSSILLHRFIEVPAMQWRDRVS
ncbi:acyltransferase family protein [uncultured Devosia sp.]|uniref:acyltransferase family protein n=1 Tax=uncultured Devosia sp. TaxID=211434 RepID=UPI0035CA32F7